MKLKKIWRTHVFRDKPRYCRFPIFFGGERQIHMMQPYNDEGGEFTVPKTADEWFKLAEEHGQVVFSLEAVEDFITALREFKEALKEKRDRIEASGR